MSRRHAALIIGQSGTGKTMATKKLYEELREAVPGLARVSITLGPQQLRDDKTAPPVLYDIEDPWGRFDFDPKSRPWNDQLAHFFSSARHDRMIIATSRLDVAQSAGVLDGVKPWLVGLEAEHYGAKERRQLYRTRIDALPRKLQAVATKSERTVLDELATPLELQKFFDALPTIDSKVLHNPTAFISEAIRRAHQNSIERTVIDQIEERNDVWAAAVLWGLLKANDRLSLNLLRIVEEALADHGSQFEKGVSPLVAFFVAARNLRQADSMVTYYHPRVEAGIEQALGRGRLVVKKTLRLLIDILLSLDGPGEAWGVAASARLIAAADRSPDLKPEPSPSAQAKIDNWLEDELVNGGKSFEANLDLAAAAGSSECNVSEVARFLLSREDGSLWGMHKWAPPEHDEAWYGRMRTDPAVKPVIETFIREVLPKEHSYFGKSFVAEAERLAPGLTPAFLAAASHAVHYGVIQTSDAIAEGALNDLDGFEAVVDAAVETLTPSESDRRKAEETHLAIVNDEYSEGYAESLADNEDGYTASEFLDAYVDCVRGTRGWRGLAQHRHRDHLLFYWFRALVNESTSDAGEVAGAFAAGHGTKNEDNLWHVVMKAWDSRFEDALVERVCEGHSDRAIRIAALTCLVERALGQLPVISQTLIDQSRQARLAEIAIELGAMRHRQSGFDGERRAKAAVDAAAALPPPVVELSEAAFALETKKVPTLSEGARKLIEAVQAETEDFRVFRLMLDEHFPMSVNDDVRWLLENTTESDNAVKAIEAAIRHGLAADIEGALTHRFSAVVALALKAIATPMAAPLPNPLLALAKAKGGPVRLALVKLIDSKPHPEHLPTLLHLVKDKWSCQSACYDENDDYPIAQAAVPAIAKSGPLTAEAVEELYRVTIDTRDSDLRYEILALLVRTGTIDLQMRLFELAVTPGRATVRRSAAHALLAGRDQVAPEVIALITPQILSTRTEAVASRLLLLLALRGDVSVVLDMAAALATNDKRRVLLLLAIWILRDQDRPMAERIAALLPANHAAVGWALGGATGEFRGDLLDDLGDPLATEQVLQFMKPKKPKKT
jgi:hypothetical protein